MQIYYIHRDLMYVSKCVDKVRCRFRCHWNSSLKLSWRPVQPARLQYQSGYLHHAACTYIVQDAGNSSYNSSNFLSC